MKRADILQAAEKCVTGQREREYGSPENNFDIIAKFWSIYTGHLITAKDVGMMMALLKIARIKSGNATEDSYVDIAGYAAITGEIDTEEKEIALASDYTTSIFDNSKLNPNRTIKGV